MRKFPSVVMAVTVVLALILAACGGASPSPSAPASTEPSEAPSEPASVEPTTEPIDYLVCMVSDTGGFDDASFNQSGLEGLQRAVTELQGTHQVAVIGEGDVVEIRVVEAGPQDGSDIVIAKGLSAGERIVIEGIQKVRNGSKVAPQEPGGAEPPAVASPAEG